MAENQQLPGVVNPLDSIATAGSVRDQISFDDSDTNENEVCEILRRLDENETYNTFVTDMDTNEMIQCHIEPVDLPEYNSTNMDSNENIMPCNIESFCSMQLTEFENHENESDVEKNTSAEEKDEDGIVQTDRETEVSETFPQFCKICNAKFFSEIDVTAHYTSKRHAKNQAFFWASFLKTKIEDKPVVVDDTEIKKKGLLIRFHEFLK